MGARPVGDRAYSFASYGGLRSQSQAKIDIALVRVDLSNIYNMWGCEHDADNVQQGIASIIPFFIQGHWI